MNLFKKKRVVSACGASDVSHSFANPFREQSTRGTNYRSKAALFALIFIILFWLGLLFYLPFFQIKRIIYLGLNSIIKEDIDGFIRDNCLDRRFLLFLPGDNYFLINVAKIEDRLQEKYSLNAVEVKKFFPSGLRVDLEEKFSSIIYDNGRQYYLIDNEGQAVKFLADVENGVQISVTTSSTQTTSTDTLVNAAASGVFTPTSTPTSTALKIGYKPDYKKVRREFGNYPILYDKRGVAVEEKQKDILSKELIVSVIAWVGMVEKGGLARVRYLEMGAPQEGIATHTNQPWKIFFQPADNLQNQLNNLRTILHSNRPNEYIDLRFGERVYWK